MDDSETRLHIGSHALAAARLLSQAVTFSDISLSKTNAILGQPIDISRNQASFDDDDESLENASHHTNPRYARSQQRRRSSSVKRVRDEQDILLNQAGTFRDFEHLFAAIDALEAWKRLADKGKQYVHCK